MSGIGGFWSTLLQYGGSGLQWLYNNTIGAATSFFGNVALSSAESFVLTFADAALSLFAFILGQISAIGIGWADEMGYISSSLGIIGPFAAILIAFGLLIALFLATKLLVTLL